MDLAEFIKEVGGGPSCAVGFMHLEHILRQIEPDRDNLRQDRSPLWIVADPPWHIRCRRGAVTSSMPA